MDGSPSQDYPELLTLKDCIEGVGYRSTSCHRDNPVRRVIDAEGIRLRRVGKALVIDARDFPRLATAFERWQGQANGKRRGPRGPQRNPRRGSGVAAAGLTHPAV